MEGQIMLRHRLTDEQWDRIKDEFSPPAKTGRPPRDRRQVVDAIFWILRTGSPWRDLSEALGPWPTAWRLFDQWNCDGTLIRILNRLRGEVDLDTQLWCVDGTVVRAHKCAAGGGKKGMPTSRRTMRLVAVVAA